MNSILDKILQLDKYGSSFIIVQSQEMGSIFMSKTHANLVAAVM